MNSQNIDDQSSHKDNHQQTIAKLQQLGLLTPTINAQYLDAGTDINSSPEANPKDDHNNMPWFLHLTFGFSAVLASLLFFGFLTLILFETRAFESSIAMLIIGLSLSVAGFALFNNKTTRRSTFLISLAFAISVAGQVYTVYALFNGNFSHPFDVWLFLLIQIAMTVIMPNFIYRSSGTVVVIGCMIYLLGYYQATEAGLALLALITIIANLQRYPMLRSVPLKWRLGAFELSKAVGYASAIMLLIFSTYIVAGEYGKGYMYGYQDFIYNYILAQVLLILASLYAVYLILQRYQIKLLAPTSIITACSIVVLGFISVYVSGLLATSLIIVIAMANSQRVLLALGIAALVGYIFWYYYQLDTSLLIKSISMLIIGIAILLMRWLLVIFYPANSKTPVITATADNKERLL